MPLGEFCNCGNSPGQPSFPNDSNYVSSLQQVAVCEAGDQEEEGLVINPAHHFLMAIFIQFPQIQISKPKFVAGSTCISFMSRIPLTSHQAAETGQYIHYRDALINVSIF